MHSMRRENSSRLLRLYRRYLQSGDHPSKLRLVRLIERILFSGDGAIFRVQPGFDMLLHPRDAGEYQLIQTGIYEPLTLHFLSKNLRPGYTALLAGVNFGLHTMVASRAVGDEGCVIAVEPQPCSLHRSRENFEINRLGKNLRIVSAALGSSTALSPMGKAPVHNSGWASMVLRSTDELPYYVSVQTVPDILENLNCSDVNLILLDVEGFELPVLQGMQNGPLPGILILEVHPTVLKLMQIDPHKYFDAVTSLGYKCFDLFGNPATPATELAENNLICLASNHQEICWVVGN